MHRHNVHHNFIPLPNQTVSKPLDAVSHYTSTCGSVQLAFDFASSSAPQVSRGSDDGAHVRLELQRRLAEHRMYKQKPVRASNTLMSRACESDRETVAMDAQGEIESDSNSRRSSVAEHQTPQATHAPSDTHSSIVDYTIGIHNWSIDEHKHDHRTPEVVAAHDGQPRPPANGDVSHVDGAGDHVASSLDSPRRFVLICSSVIQSLQCTVAACGCSHIPMSATEGGVGTTKGCIAM